MIALDPQSAGHRNEETEPNRLPPGLGRRLKGQKPALTIEMTGWFVDENDNELLRRCQRGDEAALDALVGRYQDRVFRLAWRVLGNAALAEEATAETLVKVWRRCGQYRARSAAGTWIYQIAVRTILDTQRSQQRRWLRGLRLGPAAIHDHRPGPQEEMSRREEWQQREERVRVALQALPERDRVLVHLHYFEDRTLAEIEAILDVPKANLKMRLARARARLRPLLGGIENVS